MAATPDSLAWEDIAMAERICQLADNRLREGTFGSGTRAVPARGVTTRARAAPGIIHAGTTAGAGGAFPGLGQETADNARRDHVPGCLAWS